MTPLTRRTFLKTLALTGTSLTLGLGLTACGSDDDDGDNPAASSLRFAVLSDLHVYDTSLGSSGSAFERYLAADRKMLLQSREILESMVASLLAVEGLQMVIIPGDLTKDGERVCHELAIRLLQPLRDAGIAVYVVPGNHDINNPHAVAFDGDSTTAVENISPDDFASLYGDFGYASALYRHDNSLSYIVEPVTGVWLVALDSCKYDDNASLGSPETSGALSDDLLGWLQPLLAEAQNQGKRVFGMLHHGVVAHFASQPNFFAEYLLDDYETVGQLLSEYGLNLVFTGHFHAQDAALADYNGDGSLLMYDVETGSCVTDPCPWRLVDLSVAAGTYEIQSHFVDSLPSDSDFASYKTRFALEGMYSLYTSYLGSMGVSGETLVQLASLAASLHVAHYQGDETPDATTLGQIQALAGSSDAQTAMLGQALYALAVDPGLADNDLSLSQAGSLAAMHGLWRRLLGQATA